MLNWLFFSLKKYEEFEQWLLKKICKIRGYHKYVNRKCDVCKFKIKIIDGGKKDGQLFTEFNKERQRKVRNNRIVSNQSKRKDPQGS